MPPGPAGNRDVVRPILDQRGLIAGEAGAAARRRGGRRRWEDEEPAPSLAEKLRLLFDVQHPDVGDVDALSVWAAGELLRTSAATSTCYVRTKDLIKQEGIIFRHLLRLILLCGEFAQVTPPDTTAEEWQGDLRDLADRLTDDVPAGRPDQHRRDDPAGALGGRPGGPGPDGATSVPATLGGHQNARRARPPDSRT